MLAASLPSTPPECRLQEGLGEGGGSVCRLPFVVDLVLTSLAGVGQSSTAPGDLRLFEIVSLAKRKERSNQTRNQNFQATWGTQRRLEPGFLQGVALTDVK